MDAVVAALITAELREASGGFWSRTFGSGGSVEPRRRPAPAVSIDLVECRAKIKRANEHRDSLQAIITPAVSGEDPDLVQFAAKVNLQADYHVFHVTAIDEDWRVRVGILLGDVVHNLRGALDYLYWQLYCHYVRIPNPRQAKEVQFPIEDSCQGLANKREHVRNIPPSQWAVIDEAQPYNGTDPPHLAIRALRELSNRDKHRALNPLLMRTTSVTFDDMVIAGRPDDEVVWPESTSESVLWDRYLEIGTEIVRVRMGREPHDQMKMTGHIAPDVQLPEWDVRISSGVSTMIRTVEGIVDDIEALI